MNMQRHKRKEYFTVLLISNTDRNSRQFQVSLLFLRLAVLALLLLCVTAGILIFQFTSMRKEQESLRSQLVRQKQLTQQSQAAHAALLAEQKEQAVAVTTAQPAEEPATATDDSAFPSLFPVHGSSALVATFSAGQPYLSIDTYAGSHVVATADGTVVSVRSDETYTHIIDVQHESGYTTRYLCLQAAEVHVAEGTQVQAGTNLFSITMDDTPFYYQVIYNNAPIDPLTVIDAKG